jgi:hypothetical protein
MLVADVTELVELDVLRPDLLLAITVDEVVFHDPEKPRLEVGAFLVPGVVPESLEIGLLEQVLGLRNRAGHAQRRLVELVVVGKLARAEVPRGHLVNVCHLRLLDLEYRSHCSLCQGKSRKILEFV